MAATTTERMVVDIVIVVPMLGQQPPLNLPGGGMSITPTARPQEPLARHPSISANLGTDAILIETVTEKHVSDAWLADRQKPLSYTEQNVNI